ncbi:MAG: methyltransferase family protein [Ignavibacteria bacterium]
MSAKTKGWIYVLLQVIMILSVILLSVKDYLGMIPYNYTFRVTGFVMIITGAVLMITQILTFIRFGQIMSPNPVPPESYKLVQTGFYKFIRHPMYSAALFALLGVVVFYHSASGFIAWYLGVLFVLWKIRFEEKSLQEKFPEYKEYQGKTKKLIPYLY